MKFLKKVLLILIIGCGFICMLPIIYRNPQLPIQENEVENIIGIPYKIDHIPESNKRPGNKRYIKSIIVHNTANPNSTAQNERDYLVNPNNRASTSFHMVVDENEIVEVIPVNEVAFHAYNTRYNNQGIGIEICESGDYEKSERNAVWMIAYLMHKYDISLSEVKTHKDCSGKDCPRLILPKWDEFLERVDWAYGELEGMVK